MRLLKLLKPQLVVVFAGRSLTVPHDTEYLTVDTQGNIIAHGSLPWPETGFWESGNELGIVAQVTEEYGTEWFYTNQPFKI